MMQRSSSFKLSATQIAIILLIAVYATINLFRLGGNLFVITLNNFIVLPLAIGVTVLALMLGQELTRGNRNRWLWLGLTIGWALWTIAELWWAIASIIGQEVPSPSVADLFWLAGYIPMYLALWARIRTLPKIVNPSQRIGLWVLPAVALGLTISFIFIPILRDSTPSTLTESLLSILYPLADLVLLVLVQAIFFTYQHGMYGRAWVWLALGFILFAIGDLVYAYASIQDTYYPDQQVNLISTLGVDIPYNLSYLLMLVGLFNMRAAHRSHRTYAPVYTSLTLVPNTHVLIFTKADDSVIGVSQNYEQVFPVANAKGKSLAEVLGVLPSDALLLVQEIKRNNLLKERVFSLNTCSGQKRVFVSGIEVLTSEDKYAGVILLLRLYTEDYSLDDLLSDDGKGMIRSLKAKTGAGRKEEDEIKLLLGSYYQDLLGALYNKVLGEGGSVLADAFVTELQSVSKQNHWSIGVQPNTLLDLNPATLAETREALPVLFEAAKRFTIKIADETSVDRLIEGIRSRFDEQTSRNISFYEAVKIQ